RQRSRPKIGTPGGGVADADSTARAAGPPPPGRAWRAFARPVQLLGSRPRTGTDVLFLLRARRAGGGRSAQPAHSGAPAPLGLDRRGSAQEAAIHLVRCVRGRPAALPRAARGPRGRERRSAARL